SAFIAAGFWSAYLRNRDHRHRRRVGTAVSLQQSLMGRRQEREAIQEVLVIHFDSLSQSGAGVARCDQTDQNGVHVYLMLVRSISSAEPPAVGEPRVKRSVQGDDVARGTIFRRNVAIQVDGIDDVKAGSLEHGYRAVRNSERLVNPERLGVADQHGVEDI